MQEQQLCCNQMHLSDHPPHDDTPFCDMQRGQCVLHVASGYGYPQMVKALLQFNAHADCRDEVCPVIFIFYFLHFTKPSHKHELHIWHEAVLLHHAVFPFCIVYVCVWLVLLMLLVMTGIASS